MEQRWSEPPPPVPVPIISGVLQKTSLIRANSVGFAPRYVALYPTHLYSFPGSYSPNDPMPPLSRIYLQGLVVIDSKEHPNAFSLVFATDSAKNGDGKVKFIAPDVDSKRDWIQALHGAITALAAADSAKDRPAEGGMTSSSSKEKFVLNRSSKPVIDGVLQKRQGFSTYQNRWCEVRRDVGLVYGKFRSSSDESFKIIPLMDQTIATNPDKFRFSLKTTKGEEIFFKCPSAEVFSKFVEAVEQEVHPPRDPRTGRRLTADEVQTYRVTASVASLVGNMLGDSNTASNSVMGSQPSSSGLQSPTQMQRGAFGDVSGDNGAMSPKRTLYPLLITMPREVRNEHHHYNHSLSPAIKGDATRPLEAVSFETALAREGDDKEVCGFDDETQFELRDLMSEVEILRPHTIGGTHSHMMAPEATVAQVSKETFAIIEPNGNRTTASVDMSPRFQIRDEDVFDPARLEKCTAVYLESICQTYDPKEDTAGFEEHVLRPWLDQCVTYGLPAFLKRLQERMFASLGDDVDMSSADAASPEVSMAMSRHTAKKSAELFNSLNEHIVLLDLDIQQVRQCLSSLMRDHEQEEGIRPIVVQLDDTLRVYTHVREHYAIRRSIAAFCSQKDHCGLKLGVDGTIEFVSKLVRGKGRVGGTPTEANWKKVHQMYCVLYEALEVFRLEFDVFQESMSTIEAIEDALSLAQDWLALHEPLVAWCAT